MIQNLESPDSLLAALDRGESLPAHWYTDPSITALEIEQIFRKPGTTLGRQRNFRVWVTMSPAARARFPWWWSETKPAWQVSSTSAGIEGMKS
jgi:hypothetical protein